MTELIYRTATTFNGLIADEEQSLDWLFAVDRAEVPSHSDFLAQIGALVKGATTYEWLLRETDVLAKPGRWREFYGSRPTFVFTSRRLPVPTGNDIRFVNGRVEEALPAIIEAADGKDVWVVGGGDLAAQFCDAGALDRIELTVAPAALPHGAPLFPRRVESDRISLISVQRYGQFVHLVYSLAR